jgi:hypothetical protein
MANDEKTNAQKEAEKAAKDAEKAAKDAENDGDTPAETPTFTGDPAAGAAPDTKRRTNHSEKDVAEIVAGRGKPGDDTLPPGWLFDGRIGKARKATKAELQAAEEAR